MDRSDRRLAELTEDVDRAFRQARAEVFGLVTFASSHYVPFTDRQQATLDQLDAAVKALAEYRAGGSAAAKEPTDLLEPAGK